MMNPPHTLRLAFLATLHAALLASTAAAAPRSIQIPSGGEHQLTGPVTVETLDPKPIAVPWVEPKKVGLPSQLDLQTTTVKGRTYKIVRAPKAAQTFQYNRWLATAGKGKSTDKPPEGFDATLAFSTYDKEDEALAFYGSGRGGLESKERLIVEDCTFIIDFEEGDFGKFTPTRSAIYVDGYNEVLVRRCIFISKGKAKDPIRKTTASIYAADCQKVQVEDCYFEGRTIGWRGHINIWSCGPTSISDCEINGKGGPAGGVWVATGLGEGKIGYAHQNGDPELVIYPAGPVLVENCYIHDQEGKENSDGIYIQSARPYLIRNCKVEKWKEDSLVDLGFRDTSKRWGERWMVNHGGIGMVEHCELADGWIKDSVGLAGGLIFRNNLVKNAYFFFYAFDGGSFYAVGNRFDPMARVLFSGRNEGISGWTPGEGMLAKGGKAYFYNNYMKPGYRMNGVYIAGKKPGPAKEVIVSDYNAYDGEKPEVWAMEYTNDKLPLEQWQSESGQDKHTAVAPGASLAQFASVPPDTVKLPGGVPMEFGEVKAGLTGPVGVADEGTKQKAQAIAEATAKAFREKFFQAEVATIEPRDATLAAEVVTPSIGRDRTPFRALSGTEGQAISFSVPVEKGAAFYIGTNTTQGATSGEWQLLVDGKPVGEPMELNAKGGTVMHGSAELTAGDHVITYKAASSEATAALKLITFADKQETDAEKALELAAKEKAEEVKAEMARLDALTEKFPIPDLPIVGRTKGHTSKSNARGRDYLLWQTAGENDSIGFGVDMPKAGKYVLTVITTNQADKGDLQLLIDGKEVGIAALGGRMPYGKVELTEGQHTFAFKQVSPAREVGARLQEFQLLPDQSADEGPDEGGDSGEE